MRLVHVGDCALEVSDSGSGVPVVFIQTALTADELRPLADETAARGPFRTVVYHRRGYAGSTPVEGPGSVIRDARDCQALLATLGIERAHLVGYSYSGAVALQIAAAAPACTQSLILIEPPPVHTPSRAEFRAANNRLIETRRAVGPAAALEEFMGTLIGPAWREVTERGLPGAVAQLERDVGTFFDTDLPALLNWEFSADHARRIRCPAVHVGGAESGRYFAEVRELVLGWLPHAEDVLIAGADHSLVLTHTGAVADAVARFVRQHPV